MTTGTPTVENVARHSPLAVSARVASAWSAASVLGRWLVLAGVALLGAASVVASVPPLGGLMLVVAATAAGSAALVDAAEARIPNVLVIVALAAAGTGAVAADRVGLALLGLLLAGVPMLVVLLTRGIGIGDVKLAAVLGLAAGLVHPLSALATVFLMAVGSSAHAWRAHLHRLALGPWMWGSFVVAVTAAAVVVGTRS